MTKLVGETGWGRSTLRRMKTGLGECILRVTQPNDKCSQNWASNPVELQILLHEPGSSNVTRHLRMRVMTGFILFWGHQIPCFSMTFCMTFLNFPRPLVLLSVSKNSKPFPCFRVFFDLKQFNRHKLWYSPKCVLFTFTSLLSICILSMPCHLQ